MQHICARCGVTTETQTIYNTARPSETSQLCTSCIRIVIRPGRTVWQVKKVKFVKVE